MNTQRRALKASEKNVSCISCFRRLDLHDGVAVDLDGLTVYSCSHDTRNGKLDELIEKMTTAERKIAEFEARYGKLHGKLLKKLTAILNRESIDSRNSGLTVLALRAHPNSPMQHLFQSLRMIDNYPFTSTMVFCQDHNKLSNVIDVVECVNCHA